tara:strand:+ start:671 stop:952 length:282 start_codon:yes stop_codon:yes gene_type:complete
MNIDDFKIDYFNLMTVKDICYKFNISPSSYYRILKEHNLKRERTCKRKRLNINHIHDNNKNKDNKNEENEYSITKKIEQKINKVVKFISNMKI